MSAPQPQIMQATPPELMPPPFKLPTGASSDGASPFAHGGAPNGAGGPVDNGGVQAMDLSSRPGSLSAFMDASAGPLSAPFGGAPPNGAPAPFGGAAPVFGVGPMPVGSDPPVHGGTAYGTGGPFANSAQHYGAPQSS